MQFQAMFNFGNSGNSDTVQIAGDLMAISHELSSEIATALFAAKERSPGELKDLKEVVLRIHSALEDLANEDKMARMASLDLNAPQPAQPPAVKAKGAGKDS